MNQLEHPQMLFDGEGDLALDPKKYGQRIDLACFSADGTTLLVVQEVEVASIWDVASRAQIGEIRPTSPMEGKGWLKPHDTDFMVFIESIALNGDGSLALLGLNDGTAGLFCTRRGTRLATFYPPDTRPAEKWAVIRAVAFSADGSLALVGFSPRSVGVWRTHDHSLVRFLTGSYSDPLSNRAFDRNMLTTSVAASRDNGYVFGGFADMAANLWDLDSGEIVFEAYEHIEDIVDVWLGDECVRWATDHGCVWQGVAGQRASRLLATGENWWEARFAPGGEALLVRAGGGAIRRWSLDGEVEDLAQVDADLSWEAKTIGFGETEELTVFAEGARTVVLATPGHTVRVKRKSKIGKFALSPRQDVIATYGRSDAVELWHVATGRRLHLLRHTDTVSNVVFSADGRLLAASTSGFGGQGAIRPISVWEIRTGDLWCELRGHVHQVHGLAFDPQNRWLISASLDGTVRLWQLDRDAPDQCIEIWKRDYDDLAYHRILALSDGRVVIFRRTILEVWQEREKQLSVPVPGYLEHKWHLAQDESHILKACLQQTIRRWSLETGQELPGYQNEITRPDSLPSDKLCNDNQDRFQPTAGCYLWRTTVGSFLHISSGPRGWGMPLIHSTDGESIVVPGRGGGALVEIGDVQRLVSLLPFKGELSASCILPNKVLVLNSAGQLFVYEGGA